MVAKTGKWWPRQANGGQDRQMVAKTGKWWPRQANGGKDRQMVVKTGKWWPRQANGGQNRQMVAKTSTNTEMCNFHICFHYFVHPLYLYQRMYEMCLVPEAFPVL
jgi:hypothetical protein